MESTFVFDSRIASSVLLPSNIPITSTSGKKCFLCNVKEIDENYLVGSHESSLILCKVLNVPHLMIDLKKLENINYCHACKKRILKIHESLEILKKLEKEVLEEKYLIELQLETNYKVIGSESHYPPYNFGVELVNEMRLKSVKSKLKQIVKSKIDRKFCLKTKHYRIMKNITITERLRHRTSDGHISKGTTPQIYNISSETKPFIGDKLSLPRNGHLVDSASNSSFNHAELSLAPHVYDFDEIKLELLGVETTNPADVKDPFEGIVPESSFVTESNDLTDSTAQKTFICGTCEANFDDYNQLDEHCRTHIAWKSFRHCPNEFTSKLPLNTNSYIRVKNNFKCVEVFPDQFKLKLHECIHAEEKFFKCSYCEKSFSQSHRVKKRESIHTGEKLFKCGFCDKTFRDHSNKKSQEHIHKEKNPFKCGYCDKTFRYNSNMKRHERIHTGDKPIKCRYCEKEFRHARSMKRHENIHAGVKPFKCKFCEETFFRKAAMEVHERIHTGENPFKCGYCDKTFRDRGHMKTHERIHTMEKTIKCRYCDITFENRCSRKSHESTHTAGKLFKCKFCEKCFPRKCSMVIHERIHTDERPFKCVYCGKAFRDRKHMKRHERIHTGERRFKCAYCDKTFRDRGRMKKHESIHAAVKPSKCKFCALSFSRKSSMEVHERIHKGGSLQVRIL